jgi:hypothetical protein
LLPVFPKGVRPPFERRDKALFYTDVPEKHCDLGWMHANRP